MNHPVFRRGLAAMCVVGMASLIVAAPPGPLDGVDIPTDFGAGNLVAVQNQYTSFGNYQSTPGAIVQGNELDQLLVAKTVDSLVIGITGNLATNGNSMMIGINVPDRIGHVENRSEGASVCPDAPPWTLQESGREVLIDDGMTPEDPSDDTWSYGVNGMTYPCETDYMIALDVFGGNINVNLYTLYDPNGTPFGSWDPTPDNLGDADADLFATKLYVANGPINDTDGLLFEQNASGITNGGFDNNNLDGVTDTDGSTAATATTGMEIEIPFGLIPTNSGPLTGTEQIEIYVMLVDGAESNCAGDNWGYVVNQVLPPLAAGIPCDPPDVIGFRPDMSALMSCLPVDLGTLASFGGIADGAIDVLDYDATTNALQMCPTPYGDQFFDESLKSRSGGSELNSLYVTSDATHIYIGMTGNLEENGNRMLLWLDNDADANGDHILSWDGMGDGGSGMEGDALPPIADLVTDALFDYAIAVNATGAPPNTTVFVDLWDIAAQTSTFRGQVGLETGTGALTNGENQWNMQLALDNLNNDGVIGCGLFEDPCWFDDTATVETAAALAVNGFEIAVPLADIGLNPCEGPHDVHLWGNITGGDGWRSNQTMPPIRGDLEDAVWQPENFVTDWYVTELGLPEEFYRSVAHTHTTTPGVENDCNENMIEDVCDILSGFALDENLNGVPDSCDPASIIAPLADNRFDLNGTVVTCSIDDDCQDGSVCRNDQCYVPSNRMLGILPANVGNWTYRVSLDTAVAGSVVLGFTGDPAAVTASGPGPNDYLLARVVPVESATYQDWAASATADGEGYVMINDCQVAPGGSYVVQAIAQGEDTSNEASYSDPLLLPTSLFGDATGGGATNSPPNGVANLVDVFAAVTAFQNTQAGPKHWFELNPAGGSNFPVVNLPDVFDFVTAFQSGPYGGPAPQDCP